MALASKKVNRESLRRLNIIAGLLLLIQAVALLLLGGGNSAARPLTIGHLSSDPLAAAVNGQLAGTIAVRHIFDLNLAYLMAAILLITAIFHLLAASWQRRRYEAGLQAGRNALRWLLYWPILGLTTILVGLLFGLSDSGIIVALLGISGLAMLSAYSGEQLVRGAKNLSKTNYLFTLAALILPWLIFIKYIWADYAYGNGVPAYVWMTGILLAVSYAALALVVRRVQTKTGPWREYNYAERNYLLLDLVLLSLLSWIIYFGTLR